MVVVVVVVMCLLYFFDLMVVIVIIVLLSSLLVVGLVVVVGRCCCLWVLLLEVFVGVIGKDLDVAAEVNILIFANVIGVIVSTDGCIRHRVRSGRRVWKEEAQEEIRKPKCRTLP